MIIYGLAGAGASDSGTQATSLPRSSKTPPVDLIGAAGAGASAVADSLDNLDSFRDRIGFLLSKAPRITERNNVFAITERDIFLDL